MAAAQGQQLLSYLDNTAIRDDIDEAKTRLETADERLIRVSDKAQQQAFILSSNNTGLYPDPDEPDQESNVKLQDAKGLRQECGVKTAKIPTKTKELDECKEEASTGTTEFKNELDAMSELEDRSEVLQGLPDDLLFSLAEMVAESGQALRYFRDISPRIWKLLMGTTAKYMQSQMGLDNDTVIRSPAPVVTGAANLDEDSPDTDMDRVEVRASSPIERRPDFTRTYDDDDDDSIVSDTQPTEREVDRALDILKRHKPTVQAQNDTALAQKETAAKIVQLQKQLEDGKRLHDEVEATFISDLLIKGDRINELESQLRTVTKERDNVKVRSQELESDLQQARENMTELEQSADQGQQATLNTIAKQQTEISDLQDSLAAYKGVADQQVILQQEVDILRATESRLTKAKEEVQQRLDQRTAELSSAEVAKESFRESAEQFESELASVRKDMQILSTTSDQLSIKLANERVLTKQVLDEIDGEKSQRRKCEQNAAKLHSQLITVKAEATQLQSEVGMLRPKAARAETLDMEVQGLRSDLQQSETEKKDSQGQAISFKASLVYVLKRTLLVGCHFQQDEWLDMVNLLQGDEEVPALMDSDQTKVWQVLPSWAERDPNYEEEFTRNPLTLQDLESELVQLYALFSKSEEEMTVAELNSGLRTIVGISRALILLRACKLTAMDRVLSECARMLLARCDSRSSYQFAVLLGLKFLVTQVDARWKSRDQGDGFSTLQSTRALVDEKLLGGDGPQSVADIARASMGQLALSLQHGLMLKDNGEPARDWMFLGDSSRRLSPFLIVDLSAKKVRFVSISRLRIKEMRRLLKLSPSDRDEDEMQWQITLEQYKRIEVDLYWAD